jgi:hypothetical protein
MTAQKQIEEYYRNNPLPEGAIIRKITIDKDLYVRALKYMEEDILKVHFLEELVEEDFEQCELINNEFSRRNIQLIIS